MLLSSIFMSLAAKYPNKSTIKDPKNDSRTEHALDWNAITCAHVDDISHAIQGRGQHNRLAKRIQVVFFCPFAKVEKYIFLNMHKQDKMDIKNRYL